jgi:hypothetical protein
MERLLHLHQNMESFEWKQGITPFSSIETPIYMCSGLIATIIVLKAFTRFVTIPKGFLKPFMLVHNAFLVVFSFYMLAMTAQIVVSDLMVYWIHSLIPERILFL